MSRMAHLIIHIPYYLKLRSEYGYSSSIKRCQTLSHAMLTEMPNLIWGVVSYLALNNFLVRWRRRVIRSVYVPSCGRDCPCSHVLTSLEYYAEDNRHDTHLVVHRYAIGNGTGLISVYCLTLYSCIHIKLIIYYVSLWRTLISLSQWITWGY